MNEQDKDRELGIDTVGLIEWPLGVNLDYFRTEPTSYKDLERLFADYDFLDKTQVVDFGCGKGRVAFYFNYILDLPVTGIEVNKVSYNYLIQNFIAYQNKFPTKAQNILFTNTKAEDYQVKTADNTFYFFNPFTLRIFEKVLRNIEQSLKNNPRSADIIVYYPSVDYVVYLEKYTSFEQIQTIKTPMYYINNRECFKIFRYTSKI